MPLSGVLDEDTRKTVSAFQMHFRPENTDGRPDAEPWPLHRRSVSITAQSPRRAGPLLGP
ncbi:peptidoglycan-binding protein [Pantoea ananatis]|uniref:peptidoglycan-binding protein n=1 Tax=Pantoea ananas TaxID=553 RepID=UPI00299F5478|nr:peptidoglycan-binding protein [Pantoea ananatis]